MDRKDLIEQLEMQLAHSKDLDDRVPFSFDEVEAVIKFLKADAHTIDSLRFEVATMNQMAEKVEDHLKQQFDSMQIGLIAHVMWKLGRNALVIDSREINAGPFTHIIPTATMLDGYRTQYRLGKPGRYA